MKNIIQYIHQKAGKIRPFFDEYTPILHYYIHVKFERILPVSLNNIFSFVKYN